MTVIAMPAPDGPEDDRGQQPQQPSELTPEELFPEQSETSESSVSMKDAKLRALLEAVVYITDEPLSLEQIAAALSQPVERVGALLEQLAADYEKPDRGLSVREIAGGFKMSTKPEHHEEVRRFVKNLKPPLKLSLPALETLAVIAYKQPITAPEIMEIRGVQGAGVLKTLLDRRLIATAGRKQVIGKPILYKTTREFLVQFGLNDLSELPTLKEFQEIGRLDTEASAEPQPEAAAAGDPSAGVESRAEPGPGGPEADAHAESPGIGEQMFPESGAEAPAVELASRPEAQSEAPGFSQPEQPMREPKQPSDEERHPGPPEPGERGPNEDELRQSRAGGAPAGTAD